LSRDLLRGSDNDFRDILPGMLKPWRFAVLEKAREEIGITQDELAAATGKTVGWYSLIQKWKREPAWIDIVAMAARVGINLDCLVGLTCKAGAVRQDVVDRDRARLPTKKKRGGVARIMKQTVQAAEPRAGYRAGRKKG